MNIKRKVNRKIVMENALKNLQDAENELIEFNESSYRDEMDFNLKAIEVSEKYTDCKIGADIMLNRIIKSVRVENHDRLHKESKTHKILATINASTTILVIISVISLCGLDFYSDSIFFMRKLGVVLAILNACFFYMNHMKAKELQMELANIKLNITSLDDDLTRHLASID